MIAVHVLLATQVINVLFLSVAKTVMGEETALPLMYAPVIPDMLANNVKCLFATENQPMQHLPVGMELVKIITHVYAIMDTMANNVKITTAMESVVTRHAYVVTMEHV